MENNQLKEILYIAPEERTINYKWEKNSNLLSPNLAVVTVDDIEHLKKEGWKIKSQIPLTEGMVLAKHPYLDKCYMDINLAEDELLKDKFNCIGRVVKLLGVKQYKVKVVFIEQQQRELDVSGKVNYKAIKSSAEYKKREEEKYAKTYSRSETYIGNFTEKSYEEAKQLIKIHDLDELKYLVDQRKPNDENHLNSFEETIELSKELNSLTECAFSLNVLGGVFSLDANLKQTISIQKKVVLETRLEF